LTTANATNTSWAQTGTFADTISWVTPPVAHAAAFVCVSVFDGSVSSITDNQGNTFTAVGSKVNVDVSCYIYYCADIGAAPTGTYTVTVNISAAGFHAGSAFGFWISNPGAGTILDKQGNASGTATSATVTCSGANAQAAEVVVAILVADNSPAPAGISDPATTGYTTFGVEQDAGTYIGGQASFKVLAATETSSAHWTWTNSGAWAAYIATFKLAGGGGGTPIAVLASNYYQSH